MTDPDPAAREAAAFVEKHRGDLLRLCRELVAAGSANPTGRTVEAAGVVERFLAGFGVVPERVARDPEKPNLVHTLDGAGPGPHLVLNGHLDTIQPGDEAAWTVPLYELTEHDGRLHGLGMGNMKGAVAGLALAYAYLAHRREDLAGRVSLTLVADETVFGPDGAGFLLEARPDLRGDMLICGEGPGDMGLAIAEKGLLWLAVEARAAPGQGMLARRGSTATARLAAFLVELDALNNLRVEPPPVGLEELRPGEGGHGTRLSVNIGTVRGGRFVSQAADEASAEIDFRLPPGLTAAALEARVAALAARHPGVALRRMKGWDPNWTPADAPPARAVRDAALLVRGAAPDAVVRLPASDASRWRALGVPAVCYGPQPGLAAGVDDYALERDVVDCAKVYALASLALLRPAAGG